MRRGRVSRSFIERPDFSRISKRDPKRFSFVSGCGFARPVAKNEFLDLAGRRFRKFAENDGFRTLEARKAFTAEGRDLFRGCVCVLAQFDESARRFAPLFVGLGDNGGERHGGVLVEDALDFDRRDILATRDNDVLQPVLDLQIAVRVDHRNVAGVVPAALEGLARGVVVPVVTLHDGVAANDDLAHGLAVVRHQLASFEAEHVDILGHRKTDALACFDLRLFGYRQVVPLLVPRAMDNVTVGLGQAVDLHDVEAERLNLLEHGGRRRGARGHGLYRPVEGLALFFLGLDQKAEHDRGAAEVVDAVFGNGVVDVLCGDVAAADDRAGDGRHGPRVAPAVAVEHRHRIEIPRMVRQAPADHGTHGHQVGSAVMVDDTLRSP